MKRLVVVVGFACAALAVGWKPAHGQSYPIQQPKGHWQTPGPIQTAGAIQVPKGIQAISTHKAACKESLTVGADALFAFDKSTLSPDASKTLDALGPLVKKAAAHAIVINGYTDAIGSDTYNQTLSEARARTVRDWLAQHGDVPASTPIHGYGKSDPVAPNTNSDGSDNPKGRQLNRRVTVVIDTCH
jgi:outer membrane protein OmpA-like peptidoglycan-associated protein